MAKIEILVGTTLGNAEYVADELAVILEQNQNTCQVHLNPSLDQLDLQAFWLVVSSTHGAGDLPDNIQPLFNEIQIKNTDLRQLKYALCAIGDSNYDTYCQGPEKLNTLMIKQGAQAIVDKIRIDIQVTPEAEDPAISWVNSWLDLL